MSAAVVPGPWAGAAIHTVDAGFDEPAPPPEAPPQEEEYGPGGRPPGGGKGRGEGDGYGPIVPLGTTSRRDITCYQFLDASGRSTVLGPRDLHSAPYIEGLFGGATGVAYLESRWPHMVAVRGPDGKPVRDEDGDVVLRPNGFSARLCGSALMAACIAIGSADQTQQRFDGVWPAADGRGLVVHSGSVVDAPDPADAVRWVRHKAGWRDGKSVYVSAPPREQPARVAATQQEVAALLADFGMWTFAEGHATLAPGLLLGMVGCGMMAAALSFRPALYLYGKRGSGKSTLQWLMCAATGADKPTDDFSEPGLRRLYNARSTILALNEAENRNPHMPRVLELLTGASDGEGAVVVRAGEGGKADIFVVAGCFLLAAITPPHFSPAQESRITTVLLRRGDKDHKAEVTAAIERARALHPKLLRRMLDGWPRFLANQAVLRAAAINAEATSRSADKIAALLAAWQTLAFDDVVEAGAAGELLDGFREFFSSEAQMDEEDTAQQALQHLLASRVPIGREEMSVAGALSEMRKTLREKHLAADGETQAKLWSKRLGALGLRWTETPRPGVLVKNGAPAVERCFSGTDWGKLGWQSVLRSLPGAAEPATSVKFPSGGQGRCVGLPESLLALDDD